MLRMLAVVVLAALSGALMPNDIPDWSQGPQTFRRVLYPVGSTSSPPTPSLTTTAGQTLTAQVFNLPPGTVQIRVMANAAGLKFSYQLLVSGVTTLEQYEGDPNAPGTPITISSPTLPLTIAVENDWDTQVTMNVVGDASHTVKYYISALFVAEAPGQAGDAQSVVMLTASPWQAALSSKGFSATPGALNTDFTIIPALGSTKVYLHDIYLQTNSGTSAWEIDLWDGPHASGVLVAKLVAPVLLTSAGAQQGVSWDGRGRPLIAGNALVGTIVAGQAGTTVVGTVGYS